MIEDDKFLEEGMIEIFKVKVIISFNLFWMFIVCIKYTLYIRN